MSITVAFILGILSVLLMSALVLGVLAFVKVNKLIEEVKSNMSYINDTFDSQNQKLNDVAVDLENQIQERFVDVYQVINHNLDLSIKLIDELRREMDSRLDKLDNKLSNRFKEVKQIINE